MPFDCGVSMGVLFSFFGGGPRSEGWEIRPEGKLLGEVQ